MHILVAPNAFKGSLNANQAAEAISAGLQASKLNCTTHIFPIGDGGDGTGDLLIKQLGGNVKNIKVQDALGKNIESSYGIANGGTTAIIEMANAAGIRLLQPKELNPMQASSFGVGQMIKSALDDGAKRIIIGMGGLATVDGGAGILQALGVRFLGADDTVLQANPEHLLKLHQVDVSQLDPRLAATEIIVLCDVKNSLLGPEGAAAVFGPQKGATPQQVTKLEEFLIKLSDVARQVTGRDMALAPHSGTAGGAAAGLFAFLNAKLVDGASHFLELTGFKQQLQQSQLVITGEGSIDEQTLQGKGPFAVAKAAKQINIPVIGVAGKVPLQNSVLLNAYFDALIPVSNQPHTLTEAIASTYLNLLRTGIAIGNMLAINL
jgi:glycerate kinase